jgi:hypothetical protein
VGEEREVLSEERMKGGGKIIQREPPRFYRLIRLGFGRQAIWRRKVGEDVRISQVFYPSVVMLVL